MNHTVFIFGESGRMGQEVRQIVDSSPALSYAGGFSNENQNTDLDASPDIVIDFSLPETQGQLIRFIERYGSAVVSGTTGISPEQMTAFKALGKVAPVFWSANMSFGVFLMCQLTEILARYERFYSFHVEETHHVHKKDKPSGTALIIEEAARKSTSSLAETISFREGEVFGLHRFIASSKNEKLEITHEAHNRSLFAQGAVDVSQWLVNQPHGFYEMKDFFKTF